MLTVGPTFVGDARCGAGKGGGGDLMVVFHHGRPSLARGGVNVGHAAFFLADVA